MLLATGAGAIQIADPIAGTLPAGPQQPAGAIDQGTYQAGDFVQVHYVNQGVGFYNAGSRPCHEEWEQYFKNSFWWANTEIEFESSSNGGVWSVTANQLRGENWEQISSDSEGGAMIPN